MFGRRVFVGVAVCAIAFSVSACSGAGGGSGIASIDELRDAYVEAGADCEDWQVGTASGAWSEFGNCGVAGATLSLYENDEDLAKMRGDLESGKGAGLHDRALIGPNWIITTNESAEISQDLNADVIELP